MKRQARRIYRELTKAEERRLKRLRRLVAAELPELIKKDQMHKDASKEPTLSGTLRRAIHRGEFDIVTLAKRVGIRPLLLDEFLTGEKTLASDIVDRLVETLKLGLRPMKLKAKRKAS